jgi:hypothetical protein
MPRNSKLMVIGEKFLYLNGGAQNSKSIVETQDKSFLGDCIFRYSLFLSRPLAPRRIYRFLAILVLRLQNHRLRSQL